MEEMEKKNQVLAAWTKERVDRVATVKQEWNNFKTLLHDQQFYIDRQVRVSASRSGNPRPRQ